MAPRTTGLSLQKKLRVSKQPASAQRGEGSSIRTLKFIYLCQCMSDLRPQSRQINSEKVILLIGTEQVRLFYKKKLQVEVKID